MTIQINDTASRTVTVTDAMIHAFAELSGDHNPVHLDDAFAATTVFKGRVAHGMISAGLISAVIANDLPGPGSIYMGQTLAFKAPVFPNDTITTTVVVTAVHPRRPILTLSTTCTNQDGVVVVMGEATVLLQ